MASAREVLLLAGQVNKIKSFIQGSRMIQRSLTCTACCKSSFTHKEVMESEGIIKNEYGESMAIRLVLPKSSTKDHLEDWDEEVRKKEDKMMRELKEYRKATDHLQNITGIESLNETGKKESIRQLLPSGLFQKKARPMLKEPGTEVLRPSAGRDGRPLHYLFYTGRPRYFEIMNAIALKLEDIQQYEEFMVSENFLRPSPEKMIPLDDGSRPMSYPSLQKMCGEISQQDYLRFVLLLQKTIAMPYSFIHKDWLNQFRRLPNLDSQDDSRKKGRHKILVDERGRSYALAEGKKKTALARVKLYEEGSGNVTVNGKSLVNFFPYQMDREQIMFPLDIVKRLNTTDIDAEVLFGGHRSQAVAIRVAISKCLTVFISREEEEKLRLAGLFAKDSRVRERKKPGQPKARKKATWKKR